MSKPQLGGCRWSENVAVPGAKNLAAFAAVGFSLTKEKHDAN